MIRCIYCMEELRTRLITCPHCGRSLEQQDSDPRYLKPETVLQGKYIVGAALGAGGFGITYVGWDTTLERKVAIKEYYPRLYSRRDDDGNTVTASAMNATDKFNAGLDRFLQEAKSLRELHGVEGVVAVDNFFRENGTGYIIMEFLEGKDVRTMLKESTERVDYEWCRRVILTILDTLSKIHEKGILHRDIAPDNVLVTKEGIIKLIDFGAARHEEGIEVENTESLVKPGYSPIEQYTSITPQGPYTDLYATAALMYFMVTGEKPPSAIDRRDGAVLAAPSDMGVKIPEKAEMGMMMCLNIMPEHRLESAKEFMETLDGADFTPDYEPNWNLIPEKKRGLKSTRVKIELLIALLLVLVLGGVAVTRLVSEEEGLSIGDATDPDRMPREGIVDHSPEVAIDAIRQRGIKNPIRVNIKYNSSMDAKENTDTVLEVIPREGEMLDEGDEIKLTVNSNHYISLPGGETLESMTGMDKAVVADVFSTLELADDYIVCDGRNFGEAESFDGIIDVKDLDYGEGVTIGEEGSSLVEIVLGKEPTVVFSMGSQNDYTVLNSELNKGGYSGFTTGNVKAILVDRIAGIITEKPHFKNSKCFQAEDWLSMLKSDFENTISVKTAEEYSNSVSKGSVIRIKCGKLNMNPLQNNKDKNKITVVFSKGKKPAPARKNDSDGKKRSNNSGGNKGGSTNGADNPFSNEWS